MSNIPARVIEESRAADEALQQLLSPAPPAGGAEPPPPANAAEGGVAQPPAPSAPAPAPAPAPNAPNAPAPAPSVQPTSAEAELARVQQRLQTEEGRSQAQAAELAELRGRMQAMQDVIAAQRQQPQAPPAPAPSLITDADKQDFGEDMIDFVGRMIRQNVSGELARVVDRITKLERQLQQVGQRAQTAEQTAAEQAANTYFGKLDRDVAGWRETNDDPAFIDWLAQRDTFARKTRHQLLADAHNEADAATVAEFFRAYWKETGKTPAPAQTPAPSASSAPQQAPSTTVDPASLVAPTPSTSPTPAVNQRNGKIWTEAEINQVYDDRIKKRITAERFAELEKEIEQAVSEGRVQ